MDLLDLNDITIDDCMFYIKKNVKDVSTNINNGNQNYTYYNETLDINNLQIFFLFETPFHEAFCHWVFESAIFLPFVRHFTKYDNFRILVNKNHERNYKQSFFKCLDIDSKNIFFLDNQYTYTNDISYKNIPKNNISIICRNFILNQENHTLDEVLMKQFEILIINFSNIILKNKIFEKQIENLFLPRSVTQNYLPNDRVLNFDKTLKLLKNKAYTVYNTEDTDNFFDQIVLLQKSKYIYTHWGSSFYVNGFFSKNSTIYLDMHDFKYDCDIKFLLCRIIKKIIEKNNKIIIIA